MFFKIVNKKRVKGVDGLVLEISYNDSRHFFMTEEAYKKFNTGVYHFSYGNDGISFIDEDGNKIKQLYDVFI